MSDQDKKPKTGTNLLGVGIAIGSHAWSSNRRSHG